MRKIPASLAKYRSKRDFTRTAEPSGDAPVASADRLRFVIQKHAATRLHYDFRLELDGVFKSWAITRGPSIDPHDNGSPSKLKIIRSTTAISKAQSPRASTVAAPYNYGIAATGRPREIARRKRRSGRRSQVHSRWPATARKLGSRADEMESRGRQAHQLATDQASR